MTEYHEGDIVPIRFTSTTLPVVHARITAVRGKLLDIRYVDDAPIFAGLTGVVRLPGWTKS